MKLMVLTRQIFTVPDLLESEVRSAIELKDEIYLDELLGDLERHGKMDVVETVSVEVMP